MEELQEQLIKPDTNGTSPTKSTGPRKCDSSQKTNGSTPIKKGKNTFVFEPPPEAPIYRPTSEEFKDPLKYINKIRPVAERFGICKIIPPSYWKPPFALDYNKFKFTPRIQRINELEAKTRIKLNFLDQIAKFWALQGTPLKIPVVGRQMLDLYTLNKTVMDEGGPETVMKEKKWNKIANDMGLPGKGSFIRAHYDHILYPFYLFQKNSEQNQGQNEHSENKSKQNDYNIREEKNRKSQEGIDNNNQEHILDHKNSSNSNGSNKSFDSENEKSVNFRELKSLQFLGPGPKMAVCNINFSETVKSRTRGKKVLYNFDPLDKFVCKNCGNDDVDEALVGCEKCDDKYHLSCVVPQLDELPTESWKCPKCIATEVCKPLDEFGFAQAQREYSLKQFGDMANSFKKKYFKMPALSVPLEQVENEFWRVVSSIEEVVTVEYGADLHTIDVGSGFPIKDQSDIPGVDIAEVNKYADCKWNLNNFPVLEASALKHISANISGMKVPWVYVGMCFATFCWHNEDHWSYSINYLHWGEPKTWYGVPGSSAEIFEKAMKSSAKELFESQPDLLHQLVTLMNPNDLMSLGVPICRTDQKSGEFVVTFPRAYHAGFNQGYNFAEACNFTPCDWLKIGRECISHYSMHNRYNVFSHDELVCKMAEIYQELDGTTLLATRQDFHSMLKCEQSKREQLLKLGVSDAVNSQFDLMPDDERQCTICKTTCFLSALYCNCSPSKLVCLDHMSKLCSCPPSNFVLRYHYRIDELFKMYSVMIPDDAHFENWLEKVNEVVSAKDCKVPLSVYYELLAQAKEKEFPESKVMTYLHKTVQKALDYSIVAREIVRRVLTKQPRQNANKPTIAELSFFLKEMESLPCIVAEANSIRNLLSSAKKFENIADKLMHSYSFNKRRVEDCLNMGYILNIDSKQLPLLEYRHKIILWTIRCTDFFHAKNEREIDDLNKLMSEVPATDDSVMVNTFRNALQSLKNSVEVVQDEIKNVLTSKEPIEIKQLKKHLNNASKLYFKLPETEILKSAISNCKAWKKEAEVIMKGDVYLISDLKTFLKQGNGLPVTLPIFLKFTEEFQKTMSWKENVSQVLLKKMSNDLMTVLWPRILKSRAICVKESSADGVIEQYFSNNVDVSEFYAAKEIEFSSLLQLRLDNLRLRANKPFDSTPCICGKALEEEIMIKCDLCETMFHESCAKTFNIKKTSFKYGVSQKNLCSYCIRTQRPPLKVLSDLAKSLDQLVIKTVECNIFKHWMQFIVEWTKKARALLSSGELKVALDTIKENIKEKKFHIKQIRELGSENSMCSNSSSCSSVSDAGDCNIISSNIDPVWVDIYRHVELSRLGILQLKSLLVEGDLLEVTLEETSQIWLLLQATKVEFKWQFLRNNKFELPETFKLPKSKSDLGIFEDVLKVNTSGPITKASNLKRAADLELDYPVAKTRRKMTPVTQSDGLEDGAEEEEAEHETCAAANCLRPANDELDWVQCDGKCGEWFHMLCVDLERQDITDEDEYICLQCLSSQSNSEDEIELPLSETELQENDPLL